MDIKERIQKEAQRIENKLFEYEKFLWEHPEVGFELTQTKAYVKAALAKMGIEAEECGRCGLSAFIKGKKPSREERVFLLRADMDALGGIDTDAPEKAMHACGHHMHTAMLLGAAQILNENRDSFGGGVRLMFQSAEETLEGADDMIKSGILDDPMPSGAMMLHVLSGVPLETGSVAVAKEGVSAPGADFFEIKIKGRGTHGAMPQHGVDAIMIAAHTVLALCEIGERETGLSEKILLTFGKINGGKSANAIPEEAELFGSMRSFDENVRSRAKERTAEICSAVAKTFRGEAEVRFLSGCPSLLNDGELSRKMKDCFAAAFGEEKVYFSEELSFLSVSGASEDFAYVSRRIPSIMTALCAGDSREGYSCPLHNKGVRFDRKALSIGAAAYALAAVAFFED